MSHGLSQDARLADRDGGTGPVDPLGTLLIRAAAAGQPIFGPELAQFVIAPFATCGRVMSAAFPSLTERESQVLELLAAGKGNASIAHELNISVKLAHNHGSNSFTKVQESDRVAAAVKARRAGLAGER